MASPPACSPHAATTAGKEKERGIGEEATRKRESGLEDGEDSRGVGVEEEIGRWKKEGFREGDRHIAENRHPADVSRSQQSNWWDWETRRSSTCMDAPPPPIGGWLRKMLLLAFMKLILDILVLLLSYFLRNFLCGY